MGYAPVGLHIILLCKEEPNKMHIEMCLHVYKTIECTIPTDDNFYYF